MMMMMTTMMLEDDSSVGNWKSCQQSMGSPVAENCPWKIQTDFVKTRELQTQNSSSSTFTLSVDAMLIFEHESRVPKEL